MSNIEWTDEVWNPVVGCSPVSPGCLNCYAATMARRLDGMGKRGYGPVDGVRIAEVRGGRAVFTGSVRCVPEALGKPLSWRAPRKVFVNSMSDLFHEEVPFEFVDRVWAVMALSPQHTFQVLTKRPERMAEYLAGELQPYRVLQAAHKIVEPSQARGWPWKSYVAMHARWHRDGTDRSKPPPNVWLGTSVEDQVRADERIPHLLRCPAAVRFLSCEPLLGEVNLWWLNAFDEGWGPAGAPRERIDWVIVGGESGKDARSCDVAWVRSIVAQCKAAGVPCFVKQLGAWPREAVPADGWPSGVLRGIDDQAGSFLSLKDGKGGDPEEWPEDLRVRDFPGPLAHARGS
jgi:protein gp37